MLWRIGSLQPIRQVPIHHSPKATSPSTFYFWFLIWLVGYDLLENLTPVCFCKWQHKVLCERSVIEVSTAFQRRTQYLLLLFWLTWEILYETIPNFKGYINFGRKEKEKKKKVFFCKSWTSRKSKEKVLLIRNFRFYSKFKVCWEMNWEFSVWKHDL